MERWSGKIAVVTGASSGIGAAVAVALVKAGVIVVGLARRVERIEELRSQLPANLSDALHAYKCDVSSESDILAAFAWIKQQFGGVDILVNNAGLSRSGIKLIDAGNTEKLREVLDVNVMGLVLCTREAFQSMKERQVNDGHVVLINSIVGHHVPTGMTLNMYAPSKFAVTAIAETLRQEFQAEQTKIKITVRADLIVLFYTLY